VCAAGPALAIGLAEEREIGARFALEARRAMPLVREPALRGYLRRIGGRIVAQLDSRTFDYRFFIVRDDTLNAFAVPGGYVYVNTGLLTTVTDEAELAGVLAHEIVHVHAHHVVRQQEQTALINYGTLAGLLLSLVHPALGAGAVSAGVAAQLKYARQFEQEADHVGLGLMAAAGFDPAGMPRFLRTVLRTQQTNPAQVPPYFLSHPLTQERVGELEQRITSVKRPAPRPGAVAELAAAQATVRVLTEGRDTVVQRYEERVASKPDDAGAQHLLGVVYLYAGEPDRAAALLARAATAGVPRAHGDLGRALARLGKTAEARRELETQLRQDPNDAAITLELARVMIAAGERKPAAALLANALEADPELDDAEYALAECRGKDGDARGQWWHLARAYELRGEFDRARSAYEKVEELTPKDTPEREEVEKAIAMLSHADSVFGR
jgi:predicted Zn-dependent protease